MISSKISFFCGNESPPLLPTTQASLSVSGYDIPDPLGFRNGTTRELSALEDHELISKGIKKYQDASSIIGDLQKKLVIFPQLTAIEYWWQSFGCV